MSAPLNQMQKPQVVAPVKQQVKIPPLLIMGGKCSLKDSLQKLVKHPKVLGAEHENNSMPI
jgi:hypothetical protein